MRKPVFLFAFLLFTLTASAGDSLQVSFSNTKLVKGDTVEFRCVVPNYAQLKLSSATLNVWVEDIEKGKRWKYRYPMINGEVSASLAVTDKIADGRYAFNFLVQRGFFKVTGEVIDHDKKDTTITYMMIQKDQKGSYLDNAKVANDGSFRLKSTLFPDSAFFIFAPAHKTRSNYLSIKIETPLDSTFEPVLQQTRFITIGNPDMLLKKNTDTTRYSFHVDDTLSSTLLPNVTVTTKAKTRLQQYNEEYSSGLFQRDDAIIFDGIDNDEISHSIGILQFLQTKVPGLVIVKDAEGQDVAKWRNEFCDIYIDEFKVSPADHNFISPSEVAMIKVYRPPAQLSGLSGSAGAISIYTKKGVYANDKRTKHNFIVKGYTRIESSWE